MPTLMQAPRELVAALQRKLDDAECGLQYDLRLEELSAEHKRNVKVAKVRARMCQKCVFNGVFLCMRLVGWGVERWARASARGPPPARPCAGLRVRVRV
jgi:hypothetical protein